MDLKEIGAILREGRERRGLTVEAVEEKTKIAATVLLALEEGNQAKFPHPVYARGFVRSYAQLLGLDAVDLCAHFSREYPVPVDADHPEPHSPGITVKTHDSPRVLTLVRVGAGVGVLLLGVVGWYLFQEYKDRLTFPGGQEPAAEVPASPAAEIQPPMPAPLTQMQEVADESRNQSETAVEDNATIDDAANATEAPPAVTEPSAAAEPAAGQAAAAGTRTMVIKAQSTSWLQVRADGRVEDYLLRKGESTSVSFDASLSIKFGNAGGVSLELDGRPYPFEAAQGEVKTLVVQ